jgi:photosystem II stability/assembly factor-like uncharacterized protein
VQKINNFTLILFFINKFKPMRKLEQILIALLLIFTFSCSKNNENDSNINDEISFTISFSDLSNSLKSLNLNDSFPTLDDAKQIVLTIKTTNGENTKYTTTKIDIFKMNGNYFSQKLSLVAGGYKLTEFFLIDSSKNTIFATPITGSQQAQNVDHPLPIDFSISKDQITSVNVEVLATTGLSPEDFGLVGFVFHEVPTFSFLINVSEKGQMDSLLTASLIISNGTYTYSQELEAIANNVVTIREEFTEFTLNIAKEGYITCEKKFTIDSLKQHVIIPLTFECEKGTGLNGWREVRPAGDLNEVWLVTSMSDDGRVMIVAYATDFNASEAGRTFQSVDSGETWKEITIVGNVNRYENTASISSDGEKLLVASGQNRLYYSIDNASSWTELMPVGNIDRCWETTSMNSDGTIILAGVGQCGSVDYRKLYLSKNSGANWEEVLPAGNVTRSWSTSAMSSDGNIIVAGNHSAYTDDGRLYISTNGGDNWVETQPNGDVSTTWYTTSLSDDGNTIIAGTTNLYVSKNQGNTWVEVKPNGESNSNWTTTSISSDGNTIIAGNISGLFYMSTNKGDSWTVLSSLDILAQSKFWPTCAMSSDGNVVLVGFYNGRLYLKK